MLLGDWAFLLLFLFFFSHAVPVFIQYQVYGDANKVKCHCLRKCSRGQKCGSADFDETCSRSWPY